MSASSAIHRSSHSWAEVGVHLETDEDGPPAPVQLLDHPELDPVELDVGVALTDEQEAHVVETLGQLRRGQERAAGGLGDPVEDDGHLAVLPGRVADRQVQGPVVRPHAGGRRSRIRTATAKDRFMRAPCSCVDWSFGPTQAAGALTEA